MSLPLQPWQVASQGIRSRVCAGRCDQDMVRRNARRLGDPSPGLRADQGVKADHISDHKGDPPAAVVEHHTARLQFVVNVLRGLRIKTSENLKPS